MPDKDIYAHKAAIYASRRWEYAPAALEAIRVRAAVGRGLVLVDLGAGPGNLARHFLDEAASVTLVEPSAAMRQEAAARYGQHPAAHICAGRAEATGLPAASMDLALVGQAIHYFEPEAARQELIRILKPGGWLAVLRNYGTDEDLNAAIEDVYSAENGCDPGIILSRPAWRSMAFYFGSGDYEKLIFPFVDTRSRPDYIESLETASYAPHPGHPLYPRFAAAAGQVFDRFSRGGLLHTPAATELYIGRPAR